MLLLTVVTDQIQYFQLLHQLVVAEGLVKIVLQYLTARLEKVMTEARVVELVMVEEVQALEDQVIHLLSVRLKVMLVVHQLL